MRGSAWRALGPVLGVAAVVLLVLVARGRERARTGAPAAASGRPPATAGPATVKAPIDDARLVPSGAQAAGRSPVSPDERAREHLGALDPRAAWRAQAAAAVQHAARERLGRALAPDAEERLVAALATVGPAAGGLDREPLDPGDDASIAAARARTATLLDADRVCRDELGIGIAELLRVLAPDAIQDRAATPAPRG